MTKQTLRKEHYCTHYAGHNTDCGDDAQTVRDGQWLCPTHAEFHDWSVRIDAELAADPAYQALAARGFSEE